MGPKIDKVRYLGFYIRGSDRMVKSRRLWWAGHVTRLQEIKNV
jgi:hypothetical protein